MTEERLPALLMQGISKAFGHTVAVDSLDLQLQAGEFLTLLGSSGSGKTTTLNMVAGFIRPTQGQIRIDGQDATRIPPHKRGIGMVFQNYALFPHLSVAQNIAFPLMRTAKAERTGLIREALERVGLAGLEERLPRQLSGGQQQRVAFARAIVYRPRLLLMDEPFGALDKKLRESLQLEVRRLHQDLGITVLHVTHDQEEALVLSDRIAVFNRGRIEQVDSPKTIYDRPKSVFVADFIGEANIFKGIVRRGDKAGIEGDGWYVSGSDQCGETLPSGTPAALVLRPERITLVPANSPPSCGKQRLVGRVRQVVYLGGALKYEITALNQTIYARPMIDALGFAPNPGEEVGVEWATQQGVIVPF